MGTASQRKAKFYSEHPTCCFCGGDTPADTQDHIPSRSFFRGRLWPEGYVFPACSACNNFTARYETLTALLCRIATDSHANPETQREIEVLMTTIARKDPDLYRSLEPSSGEVRRWLRTHGQKLPSGMTTKDAPIISIDHPRIGEAVGYYATKIFLSLYYFHTRAILPLQGGIVFRWYSNATPLDQRPPPNLLAEIIPGVGELRRQGTSLHDQYFYQYGLAGDDSGAAVFHVYFNGGLALLGFVFRNISSVQLPESAMVLRPFAH
ncbi:HNH endonuclease [Cupriavidus sp. IK-TO18]|uniref:HNH endonuclease n=1 Tax=Cupriavidus sp. IK-TO18 TaxID=2782182 RepID=UPI001897B08B|nr:HNH endonuclease [Cupriavidus sp. IK-TO18]MBF6986743.1 HNH endonuclease [Cupriavidus sp. IK-TO18]